VDNAAMTYRALDEASARVAGLLHERGLKPGDRVGIMMPNVAEVPVGTTARSGPRGGRPDEPRCSRGGKIPDLLASAAPDDQVADAGDEDTAVILYTSGTTPSPASTPTVTSTSWTGRRT
jgi:long-chain acyl-CoA synthetase